MTTYENNGYCGATSTAPAIHPKGIKSNAVTALPLRGNVGYKFTEQVLFTSSTSYVTSVPYLLEPGVYDIIIGTKLLGGASVAGIHFGLSTDPVATTWTDLTPGTSGLCNSKFVYSNTSTSLRFGGQLVINGLRITTPTKYYVKHQGLGGAGSEAVYIITIVTKN